MMSSFLLGAPTKATCPPGHWRIAVFRQDLAFEHTALAVARAWAARRRHPLHLGDGRAAVKGQDFDLIVLRPRRLASQRGGAGVGLQFTLQSAGYSNLKVDAALKAGDWARALQELRNDPPVAFICTPERPRSGDSRVKNPRSGRTAT